jgi:DNA-binding phage protein
MSYAFSMSRRQSGFDRWLGEQRRDPAFDRGYRAARQEIDATDQIIRALDAARVEADISKAELARRIGAAPETLRRLFTKQGQNPTISMLAKLADAVGCELKVEPKPRPRAVAKAPAAIKRAHATLLGTRR